MGGRSTENKLEGIWKETAVAPNQKDQPLLLSKTGPISKHIDGLGTNKMLKFGHES
jgi:hypothetical protein